MAREYLLHFAQCALEFRIPELHSVCEMQDVEISYSPSNIDLTHPFMRVTLDSEASARRLAARSVMLRGIYEFWAEGPTYEDVFTYMQMNDTSRALWQDPCMESSFKFTVTGQNIRISNTRKKAIINSFSWMAYRGEIVMDNPDLEVVVLENWEEPLGSHTNPRDTYEQKERLRGIFVGKKIADGQRHLVDLFDLKKRVFIGNTSMEAEMSLIMANMAKSQPGQLIYDPFAGTGSMLYTSAFFGARVWGSDIDGRQMRGKKGGKSVFDSAAQYGIRDKVLDCCVFDLTQNPWRINGFLDAIVTDPPYGVRAGAKRLGRKDESRMRTEAYILPDGTKSHERDDFVPPSRPWEMSEVLVELLQQSLTLLKPGGRLVYWLPTVTAEYQPSDVPQIRGMKLVANSEQSFGKWARRLITMEKLSLADLEAQDAEVGGRLADMPAHYEFRRQYFDRFAGNAT